MAKFDAVERYMIDQGLEMMEAGFRKEIQDAEAQGKMHLFSENYVDMQMKNIRAKMEDFTSAKAKKSINKQKQTA
jgi:hypothetical protein